MTHHTSHELRKRQQNYAQRFSMTARKLAEFLQSVEAQEKLLVQRLSDQEVRRACPPSSLASGNNPAGRISEPPERIDPQDQRVCVVAQLAQQCETYGEL
jgi:hypothetical protein